MIVGLVLAGGKSSRMGGQDKSLIEIAGLPLVSLVAERLLPQVSQIVVSSKAEPMVPPWSDYTLIQDDPEFEGPLAGILSGMEWCRLQAVGATHLVSNPTDTPFIPSNMVEQLVQALRESAAEIAFAAAGGRNHYLSAAWTLDLAPRLREWLRQSEDRSVRGFMQQCSVTAVDFPDAEPIQFMNINNPSDLHRARALYADRHHEEPPVV